MFLYDVSVYQYVNILQEFFNQHWDRRSWDMAHAYYLGTFIFGILPISECRYFRIITSISLQRSSI